MNQDFIYYVYYIADNNNFGFYLSTGLVGYFR